MRLKRTSPVIRRTALLLPLCLLLTAGLPAKALEVAAKDGEYAIEVTMTGGSGKASVVTPTTLYVKNGEPSAKIQWSSSNYDYMIVDGKKYLNENQDGYSTFTIPITTFDQAMTVTADTTAMGAPHEVEYALTFYADSIDSKDTLPQEATKRVLVMAVILILFGGVLNHFVQKRRNRDFAGKKGTGRRK